MFKKSVQQGRSKRRGEAYRFGTLSPLSAARTPLADFLNILLDGFEDFAAAETARADPNAFWLPVDQSPDWL